MTVYPDCECVTAAQAREAERERHEREMARMRQLINGSRMGRRYRACAFETFDVEPANRLAYEAAKAFCEESLTAGRGLMLMGGYGAGKTHLAAAIANKLLSHWRSVVFLSVPEFMDVLRAAGRDETSESASTLMGQAQRCPVLILDDLGAERMTEWVQERLYLLIDYRYRNQLPLVVTTNCTLKELEARIGGRSFSRLYDMAKRVHIDSPDRRIRGAKA